MKSLKPAALTVLAGAAFALFTFFLLAKRENEEKLFPLATLGLFSILGFAVEEAMLDDIAKEITSGLNTTEEWIVFYTILFLQILYVIFILKNRSLLEK